MGITIPIDPEKVKQIDLTSLSDRIVHKGFLPAFLADREHYKLLAYISQHCPPGTLIADLGTCTGQSALALSTGPVRVETMDIQLWSQLARLPSNVHYVQGNCLDHIHALTAYSITMLDLDPHDGDQEKKFIDGLSDHGYRGTVICDDIYLNDAMKKFWSRCTDQYDTLDLTDIGHWSGTGVIHYPDCHIKLELK